MGSAGSPEPGEDLPLTGAQRQALRAALEQRTREVWNLAEARRAAVLVPLLVREDQLHVVLTLRSAGLRNHGGQWSFPGGRVDEGDAGVAGAALREAEEEIGIDPAGVELLGLLSDVPTGSSFTVTPVVGWLQPPPGAYRPNPFEVAEVLELPLDRLRAPGALELGDEIVRFGRKFHTLSYKIDGRNVWGATARILRELISLVP